MHLLSMAWLINVVVPLVCDLNNKMFHIYVEKFYTSPAFFSDLYTHGFEACSTVQCERKGLSEKFKTEVPAKVYKMQCKSHNITYR